MSDYSRFTDAAMEIGRIIDKVRDKQAKPKPDEGNKPSTFADARKAFIDGLNADPELAWSYHCNIAVWIQDVARVSHEMANRLAATILVKAFDCGTWERCEREFGYVRWYRPANGVIPLNPPPGLVHAIHSEPLVATVWQEAEKAGASVEVALTAVALELLADNVRYRRAEVERVMGRPPAFDYEAIAKMHGIAVESAS